MPVLLVEDLLHARHATLAMSIRPDSWFAALRPPENLQIASQPRRVGQGKGTALVETSVPRKLWPEFAIIGGGIGHRLRAGFGAVRLGLVVHRLRLRVHFACVSVLVTAIVGLRGQTVEIGAIVVGNRVRRRLDGAPLDPVGDLLLGVRVYL